MKRTHLLVLAAALLVSAGGTALAGHKPCGDTLDKCLAAMAKGLETRGWVGIELEHEDDGTLTIQRVVPKSPAEAAGLEPGDRILALGGVSYADGDRAELKKAYKAMVAGATITYTIDRMGRRMEVDVALVPVPETIRAQWIAQHLVEGHTQQAAKP